MPNQFDVFVSEAPDILAVHWGWPIALGIILVILGLIAIWKARTATIIYVRLLGALLLLGALIVFVFAFSLTGFWTEFFTHVLWAILGAIVGLVMLTRPTVSAEAMTLLLAFYFISGGILEIGFAISARVDNHLLYVMEGVIGLALGVLLWAGWPVSGLWAIGTFVGIDLLFRGVAIVAMGLILRSISE
jgi:uncharacterized membrane protein HdeD (DUF308 family)